MKEIKYKGYTINLFSYQLGSSKFNEYDLFDPNGFFVKTDLEESIFKTQKDLIKSLKEEISLEIGKEDPFGVKQNIYNGNHAISEYMGGAYLDYHSSWDLLMPVIAKIFPIKMWNYKKEEIKSNIKDRLMSFNLSHTYYYVVKFINFKD